MPKRISKQKIEEGICGLQRYLSAYQNQNGLCCACSKDMRGLFVPRNVGAGLELTCSSTCYRSRESSRASRFGNPDAATDHDISWMDTASDRYRLCKLMQINGYSAYRLSRRVGVSEETVRKLFEKSYEPHEHTVRKLLNHMEMRHDSKDSSSGACVLCNRNVLHAKGLATLG